MIVTDRLKALILTCAVWLCCTSGDSLSSARAAQQVFQGEGTPDDAVTRGILSGEPVPRNIHAIRERLRQLGGALRTHIVANGGHEHPVSRAPMFMAFETYEGPIPGGRVDEGDLFFGFFLGPRNGTLTISDGFVELIAWDRQKAVFNFWELIGPNWFYRGDSTDVLDNVAALGLGDPNAQFRFTRTSPDGTPVLRCSGCHTLGAPIMKEPDPPHNDWWRAGKELPLGGFQTSAATAKLFSEATDAANLARQVMRGIDRLVASPQVVTPLRVRLRSLFSTMEMNLASDSTPFRDRQKSGAAVEIPAKLFVDSRLSGELPAVSVDLAAYQAALNQTDSRFPPGRPDSRETRHAFLVPVRSYVDNRVVDRLIDDGLLDAELVADVLAVDMSRPVYSPARGSLIRFVPEKARDVRELREGLIAALRKAPSDDRAAAELLANLTDPSRTADEHRRAATTYVDTCRRVGTTPAVVSGWLRYADAQRRRIVAADTAQHPTGQKITEPDFREVFPRQHATQPQPLGLNPASCLAEPRS